MHRLRRLIWFLVISLALLIVAMMFTLHTYPAALESAPMIGGYLQSCTGNAAAKC